MFLISVHGRLRRWLRTRRAFAALPRHRQQNLVVGWWVAGGGAWFFALAWVVSLVERAQVWRCR